jgi:hypothetical protein
VHQIIVVGTVPPCPRCRLMTEIVRSAVKAQGLSAEVRHISFKSDEAARIAQTFGLTPGTAHDVADALGQPLDPETMPKAPDEDELTFTGGLDPDLRPLESVFREVNILDNWLRPYENAARDAGILMTPVLLADGVILHSGSVPPPASINEWLSGLK